MASHGLQSCAPLGNIVAIVYKKERPALEANALSKSRHQPRRDKASLEDLAWLAGRGEAGLGAWCKAKAQTSFAIQSNEPFMPAGGASGELAYRQAIKKFIGHNDRRAVRHFLCARVPTDGLAQVLQCHTLALLQYLARLDEVDIDCR
jgi:hypothetical protein